MSVRKKRKTKKSRGRRSKFPNANLESNFGNDSFSTNEVAPLDSPTNLHVHHFRKRLCDIDGVSIKATLDGLVASGILPDDSTEFIKSIKVTVSKSPIEKTIFRFEEV